MNFNEFEIKLLQTLISFAMGFGSLFLMIRSIANPLTDKFSKITESVINIEKHLVQYDIKVDNIVKNHNKLEERVGKIEDKIS